MPDHGYHTLKHLRMQGYTYAKSVLPISAAEFSKAFRKCVPGPGWSHAIGVADSGGPDSTSLLFLIKRYVDELKKVKPDASPQRVVSVNINHQLQSASKAMSELCERRSLALGVEFINRSIHWDTESFPERPVSAAEHMARLARYSLLHSAMESTGCGIMAFGHHLDDQVETSLIRLSKGSTPYGAAGMKTIRRWGMGVSNKYGALGFTGDSGMNHWVIRPVLTFTKDRLLATCDAHQLEYAVDQTNFQPSHTLRNAIRGFLASGTSVGEYVSVANIPPEFAIDLQRADEKLSALAVTQPPNHHETVMALSARNEALDRDADYWVEACQVASDVTGIYVLDITKFQHVPLAVQKIFITRVLRYISPFPWGSLASSHKFSTSGQENTLSKIHHPFQFKAFSAGAGVLWTPVTLSSKPLGFHTSVRKDRFSPKGWLLTRARTAKYLDDAMLVDVTANILKLIDDPDAPSSIYKFLWDCRFVIRIDTRKIPEDIVRSLRVVHHAKLLVSSSDFYGRPHIVLQKPEENKEAWYYAAHGNIVPELTEVVHQFNTYGGNEEEVSGARGNWADMRWIRELTG